MLRWRREAAAASTSPKTGATFKEGAESPRSPASCCRRPPTVRRGLKRRSGDAEKQVKSRPGPGAAGAALLPPCRPRLRLLPPPWNQEAAEWEASLPRPFLCVGPGGKEGATGKAAVWSSSPSGARGLRVPRVGPGRGKPSPEAHLAFSWPHRLPFCASLSAPCPDFVSEPSLLSPSQGITMPSARPYPLPAPPPSSSPPSTFPSWPYAPRFHC